MSTDQAEGTRVLLVEDNPVVAQVIKDALESYQEVHVSVAGRLETAFDALAVAPFDVILLDLSLPDSSGLSTVKLTHDVAPHVPIVVLTVLDDHEIGASAVRMGAEDYLVKDQADDRLIYRAVRYAIERMRSRIERDQLIERLSAALADVKKLSGLIPICSSCKKIRDDAGYWNQLEVYISERSDARFSHGICPACAEKFYGDFLRGEAEES